MMWITVGEKVIVRIRARYFESLLAQEVCVYNIHTVPVLIVSLDRIFRSKTIRRTRQHFVHEHGVDFGRNFREDELVDVLHLTRRVIYRNLPVSRLEGKLSCSFSTPHLV